MSVNDDFFHTEAGADTSRAINAPCLSPASFWTPIHIVESAWLEHGPFAFWLIDALRPGNFVELGTHNGFSYLAVCQAVQTLGLSTACYAVDSWAGDDHAGFYGEEIFNRLSATNDQSYKGFSTLLRGLFSDALPYFPDGSIDLLHIDGRHGYDDVVADYNSWRPKLSDRAIVLFHDINVREREFGVWRLWHELRDKHPSFEFLHGHGLGVLAVGAAIPPALRPLVSAPIDQRAAIQTAYARLGRAVSLQFERLRAERHRESLDAALTEGGRYARHLEAELARKETALSQAETSLAAARQQASDQEAEFRQQITAARDEAVQTEAVSRALAARLADRQAELRLKTQEILDLQGQAILVPGLQQQRDALRREIDDILNSAFWRRTDRLRRQIAAHPRLRRTALRMAKLVWWTITLQLPRRLKARLAPPLALPPPPDEKARFTAAARSELLRFLDSGERLTFPHVSEPDISIVIVLWNQAHLTLRCLRALAAASGPSREIIIFDNGSTDETERLLGQVDGIRVIRSQDNLGFLLGCNRGAEIATGRTLLLLNSDAFVRSETLEVALRTLESAPDIGAVGARLLLPTGRLQEAGSIVWSDASCLGYARGGEAEAYEAMFRRDVDYCSGAFLLTWHHLWTQLGGLEEGFVPAYYEETDYCMRLHAIGYRVVYEPGVVVDHFEFGSEAKTGDSTEAMKRNQALFKSRHEDVLRRLHLPPRVENILAARTAAANPRPRLLVIDNEVPLGTGGAGYPRARDLLAAAVRAGWSVTLFPLHAVTVDWKTARVEIAPEIEIVSGHGAPRFVEFMHARRGYYDTVLISRPENMMLVRGFLASNPTLFDGSRIIYDSEALAATRQIAKAAVDGTPFSAAEAGAMIAAELALADDADAIICVNDAEAEAFRGRGAPVHVLGHSIACAEAPPDWADRSGFLFIGRLMERDAPNWEGLAWFIRAVWPLIRAALPLATLSVIGRLHPAHEALEAPGVRLLGPVDDLRPAYDAARVFIAPVHFAAGIPAKIIEAAAAAIPVVGTALMARQLAWQPGVEIAAADKAEDFATAAIALHQDAEAWRAMSTAAQQRVREAYSPEAFTDRVSKILG